MVAHARAFHLDAIDIVNIHYKDIDKLRIEAEEGY